MRCAMDREPLEAPPPPGPWEWVPEPGSGDMTGIVCPDTDRCPNCWCDGGASNPFICGRGLPVLRAGHA